MVILTPLRWPGGKSRFVKHLDKLMPADINSITEIREPFVGGGSVFLYLKTKYPEKTFWINDIYYNLYCFWTTLQLNGDELFELILKVKTDNNTPDSIKDIFIEEKANINNYENPIDVARAFYILNKCSYSGLTETGTFAPLASIQNFSVKSIHRLKETSKLLKDVKITNLDYSELLKDGENIFIYLDPPYDITNKLYGKNGEIHKVFNHELFYDSMVKCKNEFLISYNGEIKEKYKDFNVSNVNFTYAMTRKSGKIVNKEEIVITNY